MVQKALFCSIKAEIPPVKPTMTLECLMLMCSNMFLRLSRPKEILEF